MLYQRTVFLIILSFSLLLLTGCKTYNMFSQSGPRYSYERLVNDTATVYYPVYRIKKGDKVSVSVWSHDELGVGSVFGIYNSNEVYGKWVLVNESGTVTLPKINKVPVQGLTMSQAADTIAAKLARYIIDPTVVVQVHELQVTVLGEVMHPGKIDVPTEENTLAGVIAESGGFTDYADMRKVVLVRDTAQYAVDLQLINAKDLNSLHVRAGDVVYVPTRKGKVMDKKSGTIISLTGIITGLALLFNVF